MHNQAPDDPKSKDCKLWYLTEHLVLIAPTNAKRELENWTAPLFVVFFHSKRISVINKRSIPICERYSTHAQKKLFGKKI